MWTRRAGEGDGGAVSTAWADRPALLFLFALCLSWGVFNLGRALGGPKFGLDFTQHYVASRLVLEGRSDQIYADAAAFRAQAAAHGAVTEAGASMTNAYPPFAALVLLPLALLPFRPALWLFTAFSVAAWAAGAMLFVAGEGREQRRPLVLAALLLTFSFFPVHYSLYMGQVNAFVFLLAALAFRAAGGDRPWLGGLCVALATVLKVFPAVLIAYFAVRRKPRAAVAAVTFVIVLTGLSLPILGTGPYKSYLADVLLQQSEGGAFYRNQGLAGALARLLTDNGYVHAIANDPFLARSLALGGGVLLLVVALAVAARAGGGDDVAFGFVWAATLLALPKSWEHYGGLLLFAYLAVTRRVLRQAPVPRGPLFLVFFSFCVWTFLLPTGSDYEQLPRSVGFQPVFSAKFLATALLFAACVWLLRRASPLGLRR